MSSPLRRSASLASVVTVLTLVGVAPWLVSCGDDEGDGGDGKGGSSSTTGGAGGGGGMGGQGGAGATGVEPQNTCECFAAFSLDPPAGTECASCFSAEVESAMGTCVNIGQSCLADTDCRGVLECLVAGSYAPEIVDKCIPKEDSQVPGHLLFYEMANCVCPVCEEACDYPEELECKPSANPENCACVLASVEAGECATCTDATLAGACATEAATCNGDDGCAAILTCIDGCTGTSRTGDCMETCLGDHDASREAAEKLLGCSCASCATQCDANATCP